MKLLRLTTIVALVFLTVEIPRPAEAQGGVLLKVMADRSTRGETIPSRALTAFFLKRVGHSEDFSMRYCLLENKFSNNEKIRFFRIIKLKTMKRSSLYMFRPGLKPYCDFMYGGSNFRLFLFIQTRVGKRTLYKTLFDASVNTFSLFKTMHHGLPDFRLLAKDDHGYGLLYFQFDGTRYRNFRCARLLDDDLEHRYPCDTEVPLAMRYW
jgi:hypothetical protein